MLHLQVTKTTMELLPLVCVSLLTWSGTTFADENGQTVIKMVEKEDSDVILPCSLSTTNIKQELFDWKKDDRKEVYLYDKGITYNNNRAGQDEQFKGRVSHFPEQLEFGNASIIIRKAKVTDSGKYTCDFPHLQPKRRSNIELVVGAARKPSVKTHYQTKNWALLQCEVQGAFPKPKLHWEDSDGNILKAKEPKVTERGGRYDVILQTNVTKTDNYHCVATQEEINHQIYAETYVFISEPNVINVTVMEGSDVILPCSLSSKEDIESKFFDWKKDGQKEVFMYDSGIHTNNGHTGQDEQFKGRVSHFEDELKSGNASIIIRNTTVADSGDYTCEFPQLQPRRQIFHIKLHVGGVFKDRTAENIPGSLSGWVVAVAVLCVVVLVLLGIVARLTCCRPK